MTAHARYNVTRAAEGLGRRRFTVAEVEAMVEAGIMVPDERVELIGGDLVPMSPKGLSHEVLKAELNGTWYRTAPDSCDIYPSTTFRLSKFTYLEADFVICERSTRFDAMTGGNVLLVVEVADSSWVYDTGRKAAVYAAFGVRELWVIEAEYLTTRVFREPAPDGYRQVEDISGSDVATPLFAPAAFALRLADLDLS